MPTPLLPRYILCQFTAMPNSSKTNKIPLNPLTLCAHNPLDTSIHRDYETIKQTAYLLGDGYGIGFVLMPEDKYFCIDLDNCLHENETWDPIVIDTLEKFTGAYAEVSNSRRGIHIIGRYEGEELNPGNRLAGIEVYTSKRFIALAEIDTQGDANTIHTVAIKKFIEDNFPKSQVEPLNSEWTTESHPDCKPPEDNLKLIEFILNRPLTSHEVGFGKKQPTCNIKDLFEANEDVLSKLKQFETSTPGEPYNRSDADSALAYRLHYWLGGNCERVEQIMRLSKLYREKWDNRPDYLPRTIINARGKQKNFFLHEGHHIPKANNTSNGITVQQKILSALLYPEISERGKVLDTSNNLKHLLETFGISTRWNIMARKRETLIPGVVLFSDDSENDSLRHIKDLALINSLPIIRIDENLDTLAQKNNYHPIVEGLKQNIWDGVNRLDLFINTIESSTPDLSYKLIRRWMISAIAAAHSQEGFKSSGVLVLSGAQNIGKTIWIRNLDPFNCKAIKEGAILDPTNKDCLIALASVWIAELGELDATFRKADMARLKSYLTNDNDTVRAPYARKDSVLARRTVFAASVNDSNFLMDETGNRRWWTIPVLSINQNHGLGMAQVWAEVYSIWKSGEQTYLTSEEFKELNIHNKDHEQLNPLEEMLYTFYDFSEGWENDKSKSLQSSTEVLRHLGYDKPSRSQCTQMGKIIINATGRKPKRDKTTNKHELVLKSKSTS